MKDLALEILPGRLAVAQLSATAGIPADWDQGSAIFAFLRTGDEVTVVCAEESVPLGVRLEPGWRAFKVDGPLDFSLVGILAKIITPLAQAGISIFALSTYNTDFILVKETDLARAAQTLLQAGLLVREGD